MRFLITISLFLPLCALSQSKYYDFNFELTDTIGKKIIQWEKRYNRSKVYLYSDKNIVKSGTNCLGISAKDWRYYQGCTLYTSLPKELCKGLRKVHVTVNILFSRETQNGGLWVFATKGIKYLGKASTYWGYIPYPIIFTEKWQMRNPFVTPEKWYKYELNYEIEEDPDEILLGFYVRFGYIWYDNIQIILNDKPIENLVFQLEK